MRASIRQFVGIRQARRVPVDRDIRAAGHAITGFLEWTPRLWQKPWHNFWAAASGYLARRIQSNGTFIAVMRPKTLTPTLTSMALVTSSIIPK